MPHLSLRKIRSAKSNNYREAIVFKEFRFQNFLRPPENKTPVFTNSLKRVFEKLRFFIYGLLYTVGLTVELEIKLRVQISPLLFGRCLIFFQYDK